MAQTIKLKRSATSGAIPTTSSLALGEVAINTYDGKMYIKKDVGGTETIVQVGAGSDSVSYLEAGMIEYEYTATSNQTSFSGSDDNSATLSYVAESIMVFVNGVLQDDGVDYTASNGTSVVFGTGLAAADEVRIVAFTNVTTAASLQDPTKLDAISTVNNQAAYSLTLDSSAYTPSSQNALIVSLNGITQEPGDSFTISGSTITFSPALVTGDVVDYIVDMGRAVTIGEYSGDLAVGGELEVAGDIIGDLRGATLFKAKAGEALSKGSVVYISGISGNTTVVSKADANDAAKMPSFGVAAEAASANNPVDVYTFGVLSGIDTSSYSEGDELFVSNTAGVLTSTPPTGETSKLQKIAKVTRSHASAGSIFIMGAGRSNAVPNLDDGDIFIGNSSNQAVTAALDTSIVPESGNLYYTDARVDSRLASGNVGNITTTGYLRGPATFTIDPAAHGDDTGTLVVAGNLQVDGTTTTINSTTMTVDDKNITLASGAANAAAADGAGITVDGASATLTYTSTPDSWSFNKNVGIGTASPDKKLVVSGAGAEVVINDTDATDTPRLRFRESGATSGTIHTDGSELILSTGTTERMRIDSSGKVGIGETDPTFKLNIKGDGSSASSIKLERTGSLSGEGRVGYNYIGTFTDNDFIVYTNSDEAMRIAADGSVGIGETNPSFPLEVNGGTGDGIKIKAGNSINDDSFLVANSSDTALFKVDGAGKISIGNNIPLWSGQYGGALLLKGDNMTSDRFAQLAVVNSNGVITQTGVVVQSSGNVGIGTNSPDSLLHVDGAIQAKSSIETYQALTGTTVSIDCSAASVFSLSTSGATTFSFANVPSTSNTALGLTLEVTAGGTHTLTWPASVKWAGGTAPDAPASGETNIYGFYTRNAGTTWYGFLSGAAMA